MDAYHTACRTIDWQPAWGSWEEGAELFWRLSDALDGAILALAVMPDHFHSVTTRPATDAVRAALSGYTRWRNHRSGARGCLWMPVPEPLVRSGAQKLRRDQRYVELNPCRAGLVADPLAWPLTTWRDRMGLALPLVRPRANDPARWFAYATRDDYVQAGELPYVVGVRSAADVEAAVSSVLRVPLAALRQRGSARTLLVASLRRLTELGAREIAGVVGMTAAGVRNVDPDTVGVEVVARVAGDARFAGLGPGTLSWRAYASRQRRNADALEAGWR